VIFENFFYKNNFQVLVFRLMIKITLDTPREVITQFKLSNKARRKN